MSAPTQLAEALRTEREAFLAALDAVDLELVTVPGVVDEWSVRDLIVHVAFWAEHGTEAITLAQAGRGDEFAYSTGDTDSMNARLHEESRGVTPDAALEREEAAFTAFIASVEGLEPSLLDVRLGNGDTVAEVIAYDGPNHYREHAAHIRDWFAADDETDADEADADDAPPDRGQ